MTTFVTVFNEARNKFQFIPVSSSVIDMVDIVDAQNLWIKYPLLSFNIYYRIFGFEQDMNNFLISLGISNDEIQKVLNTSFNFNNYNSTHSYFFKQELEQYRNYRRNTLFSNINEYGTKLHDLTVLVKSGNFRGKGVSNYNPPSPQINNKLTEKMKTLASDKVIDVSNIKQDGSGSRIVNISSKKMRTANLPFVSDNIEHYVIAINLLPGGQEKYINDINMMIQLLSGIRVEGKNYQDVPADPNNKLLSGTLIQQTEFNEPSKIYGIRTKQYYDELRKGNIVGNVPQTLI